MPTYQRYRKVPAEVNAIQFTGYNVTDVTNFAGGPSEFYVLDIEDRVEDSDVVAVIYDKLHSTYVGVKLGDWIIEGIKGEHWPVDGEVFEVSYEAI